MLDEVGRSKDAMAHRQYAVKMEPAGWTYQGMANTLTNLQQRKEADAAYEKATQLSPKNAQYWASWAWSQATRKNWQEVCEICPKGLSADPKFTDLWHLWGVAEEQQGHLHSALEKYQSEIDSARWRLRGYQSSARLLDFLGRKSEADQMRFKSKGLH